MAGFTADFRIEHECPQCGAPVTLEETDRLFSCAYCRTRLAIHAGDYFRYYLPPPSGAGDEIFLAPYWRFRGMDCALRADPFRVGERVLDVTVAALGEDCLPPSLGLRPQAMRLRFATPGTKVFFLAPKRPLAEALAGIDTLLRAGDDLAGENPAFHREFLAETASLVYTPLTIREGKVVDLLLGREITGCSGRAERIIEKVDRKRGWEMRFIPALCPECGWDLIGDRRSVVLLCPQCRAGWQTVRAGLRKVAYRVVPGEKRTWALPFWRLKIGIRGLRLETGADLVRFGNIPVGTTSGWGKGALHFWAPAFRFPPRLFLRLARQVTILQLRETAREGGTMERFLPVDLDARQALGTVKVVLAQIGVPKKEILPLIPKLAVRLREAELVFLPFEDKGGDFVQPRMGFAVPKSALYRFYLEKH